MSNAILLGALTIVAAAAYLRGACVILAFVRTLLMRRRFVRFRMGWVEAACMPEPLLLLVLTYVLQRGAGAGGGPSVGGLAAAIAGVTLVLAGWDVLIWAFLSWPSVFAGHGVLADHQLVTRGAYGFVRHPVYLAAVLIWLGLGVGFASVAGLLVTALYVVPVYLLYIRSEEAMMTEAFGDAYEEYRRRVPMLVPRLGRSSASTRPLAA